jgi:carnitine 3-dehydrogenase
VVQLSDMEIRRVAVIGAGTIGASWAALFLAQGLEVAISDPAEDARDRVRQRIDEAWPVLERLGLAPGASPDRWRFHADPGVAADGCDFCQESAPERYEVKIDLFRQIDRVLPREVVIASSSAGLLISRLQEHCNYPERCVIGHPCNPPHLVPLVEVVGGFKTGQHALATALDFYRAIGKYPIEIHREIPGHLANRLQAALWREAVHLVAEGVATVEDVDAAITQGPGLRWAQMGPHLTCALAGGSGGMEHFMAHLAPDVTGRWSRLGTPVMTDALKRRLIDGVETEIAGRTINDLARSRDDFLVRLLEARRAAKN